MSNEEENIGNWCIIEESDLTEKERQEFCDNTSICYDCEYNNYHDKEE